MTAPPKRLVWIRRSVESTSFLYVRFIVCLRGISAQLQFANRR